MLGLLQAATAFVLFSPWGRVEQNGLTDPYTDRTGSIMWSGPDSFDLYQSVFLWGMPVDPLSQDGLGGGITWALHPRFCDQLLPRFPEASRMGAFASFLTCEDLRHAVASAFGTVAWHWVNRAPLGRAGLENHRSSLRLHSGQRTTKRSAFSM